MRTAMQSVEIVAKFGGNLWACRDGPLAARCRCWHGNYAPYRYDLRRFNTSARSRSIIPTLRSLPFLLRRPVRLVLRIATLLFSQTVGSLRGHVPSAVVPPQLHVRVHGPHLRRTYDAKEEGFFPAAARCTTKCRLTAPIRTLSRKHLTPNSNRKSSRAPWRLCSSHAMSSARHNLRWNVASCRMTIAMCGRG